MSRVRIAEQRWGDAESELQKSLKACSSALEAAPGFIEAIENNAKTLRELGQLYMVSSKQEKGIATLTEALRICHKCLRIAPNKIEIISEVSLIEALLKESEYR